MGLSKLSIFTKDTDAAETIKGYEYQKLRTLESWLETYIKGGDQIIYCDYEEDIFSRDQKDWVSKFIQLKLYSSKNFSFASKEITKAISHFFILFVKGDYKFDQLQFVFETNVKVAARKQENDAELLKDWRDNQGALSPELLNRCVEKVKSIVFNYAEPFGQKVKDEELLKSIDEAKIILKGLPDNVWMDFVKSIKWNFEEVPADVAISSTIDRIYDMIEVTGYATSTRAKDSVFANLYYAVAEKSAESDAENRKLSSKLLDAVLLRMGDKDDKWYNEYYQLWHGVEDINCFLASEFYQVLHSANYCRYKLYLKKHDGIWKKLLSKYIVLDGVPTYFKRRAIYELAWLSFPIKRAKPKPIGTLKGQEGSVRLYYETLSEFPGHSSIEDAQNLLGLLKGAVAYGEINISENELELWESQTTEIIYTTITNSANKNELCNFHDIAASLLMQQAILAEPETVEKIFNHFEMIMSLVDQAPMYDIVKLGRRINEYIKLLIHHKAEVDLIERLEDFSDKLMPIVAAKKGAFATAKIYSERGFKYLNSTEPKSILRALTFFHKAKELYRNDGTMEGFVLTLLSISQLYSATGNNFAAKFYALSAISQSSQSTKLHNRISDGFGLLLQYDFEQGAWINCLEDFRLYINSRIDFKDPYLDIVKDHFLGKSFTTLATIISLSPKISSQLSGFIEFHKQQMNDFYKEHISHLVESLNALLESDSAVNQFLDNKCVDSVINDIGTIRTIRWLALGTSWQVKFNNNWLETSIAEETAACLQILLLQFAIAKNDIHFLRAEVEINIVLSDEAKPPEQVPSNHTSQWDIFVTEAKDAELQTIKMQAAFLTQSLKVILSNLSLLPEREFETEFQRFFKEEDLSGKTLPGYLYQRLYRNLFTKSSFDTYQRDRFIDEKRLLDLQESPALRWDDSLSNKYSFEKSIELIKGRYNNSLPQIYLTLQDIKKDPRYDYFINSLKKEGWLDWQITMSIYNHILNYKAHQKLAKITFFDEEKFIRAFNQEMRKLGKVDEKDNFIRFGLDFFLTDDFKFDLQNTAMVVLRRWGLDGRAIYPNFQAIQELLVNKFNFSKDESPEDSPL